MVYSYRILAGIVSFNPDIERFQECLEAIREQIVDIYWHAGHQRWVATGRQDGKLVALGEFKDISEAAEARQEYVMKTYGDTARKMGIV